MKTYTHFVGIDIAKNKADVAWHNGKKEQIANTPAGVESFLVRHAEALKNALVVVEATGGYELLLIHALLARGVAVHRVAPRTACHYRLSVKQRGKTDALDAVILARYGAERHAELPLFQRPAPVCERLAALQAPRADLVGMRANEKKRLQQAREDWLKANIGSMIAHFDAHIQQLEQEIEALIAASPELRQKSACLQTIPGIGAKTAATLLAKKQELTMANLNLRSMEALGMREAFQQLYQTETEKEFSEWLQKWLDWVLNCDLEPMRKAAQTVQKHRAGIQNWIQSRINNGLLEGLNSIIQAAKRKARGYGKKHFATIAFLLTGKLNFRKVNPFLPTRFG